MSNLIYKVRGLMSGPERVCLKKTLDSSFIRRYNDGDFFAFLENRSLLDSNPVDIMQDVPSA